MSIVIIALAYVCLSAELCLVQSCLKSGPSHEDFISLNLEVQSIKRELHNLESKHENFVSESRNKQSKTVSSGACEGIDSLTKRLDQLEEKQNKLENLVDEKTKQSIKKTVDNLEKQINGKIASMDEALSKIEKSNADHVENSLKTLEKSVKEKLKEFQHQLTESGESSQEKHTFVLESLDKLNNIVKSDLKAKVDDFDQHITSIRTSKDEADKLLTELQIVVEKIHPNTFNKESAVKAFLLLVVVVLFITVWVYKIQQTVTELKKCP